MTIRAIALIIVAAGLSAAAAAGAEPAQDAASAAAAGQIDFTYNGSRPAPGAADRTMLQARGVAVRDFILATPALAQRRGFALHASVVLQRPVASQAGDPDEVRGSVLSRRIDVTRSRPDAKGRYPGQGEGPALLYSINRLEDAFGYRSDAGFFTLPPVREERSGVLRLERAGRDYVVIAPAGQSAYQPVSIGDYAAAAIRHDEASGSPELAAEMRAAVARLTPVEQARPYCVTRAAPSRDLATRCGQAGSQPVVRFNPRLAPGAGGASRARLIVIGVLRTGRTGDSQERERLRAAFGQLDLVKLQGLLADR